MNEFAASGAAFINFRVDRDNAPSVSAYKRSVRRTEGGHDAPSNVKMDCGWGRLIFGHTFRDNAELAGALRGEGKNRRDIAMYIGDPHVVLSLAPHDLFLDPSHTYRLYLEQYRPVTAGAAGYQVRKLQTGFVYHYSFLMLIAAVAFGAYAIFAGIGGGQP